MDASRDDPGGAVAVPVALARNVARAVRSLLRDTGKAQTCFDDLAAGRPYVWEEEMVIVMIDISGYSSLTSEMSRLGQLASELITKNVGVYLNNIIDLVYTYGGDIVKFLGDAVLVAFTGPDSDRRGMACATHALLRYPSITVESASTSTATATSHRNAVTLDTLRSGRQDSTGDPFAKLERSVTAVLRGGGFSSQSGAEKVVGEKTLGLHVAVARGPGFHVILGDPTSRLDYSVRGRAVELIGPALDEAGKGELGVGEGWGWDGVQGVVKGRRALIELHERCVKSAWDDSKPDNSAAGELASLKNQQTDISYDGEYDPRQDLFVNRALVHRLKRGVYEAEFRSVHVVFVKLRKDLSAGGAHVLVVEFLKSLERHGGTFQQYSVDDKGQTMLAVFGLPPFTNANDGEQAARACLEFHAAAKRKAMGDIVVTMASGQLLLAHMGTASRGEASLLGDVVNVAARLMSLPHDESAILLDDSAKEAAGAVALSAKDFGWHKVKGKPEPIRVWGLFDPEGHEILLPATATIRCDVGYRQERAEIRRVVESWLAPSTATKSGVIIVEGPSGYGKSRLVEGILDLASNLSIPLRLTQSSEMEQLTSLLAMRSVLTYIFDQYCMDLDGNVGTDGVASKAWASSSIALSTWSRQTEGSRHNLRERRRDSTTSTASRETERISKTASKVASRMTTTKGSFRLFGSGNNGTSYKHQSQHLNRPQSLLGAAQDVMPVEDDTALLSGFLKKFGEREDMAPVIAPLFPRLRVQETNSTRGMDAAARKSITTNIVLAIVREWTSKNHALFVFDDAQWMDKASAQALKEIYRSCPKACVIIFTRPIAENKNDVLKWLVEQPDMNHIVLNGISESDMAEMVLLKFKSLGVQSVDQRLTEELFHRTAGSPLMADLLAECIRLKSDTIIDVSQSGHLRLTATAADLDRLFSNNVSAAITVQFDRLDPAYQAILRRASVLGQYFSLSHVLDLMDGRYESAGDLRDIIVREDRFAFLVIKDDYECMFRHITIMNTIYNLLPYSQRQGLHRAIGERLEREMGGERFLAFQMERTDMEPSREFHLSVVCFHFSRSNDIVKHIDYVEEFSLLCMFRTMYTELLDTLPAAIERILSPNRDKELAGLSPAEIARLDDPMRLSLWYAMLSFSYSAVGGVQVGVQHGLQALKTLNINWPSDGKQLRKEIIRNAFTQFILFNLSRGGRRKLKTNPLVDTRMRALSVRFATGGLFLASIMDPNFPELGQLLLLLMQLNLSIKLAFKEDPVLWGHMCVRASYATLGKLPAISKIYAKAAQSARERSKSQLYGSHMFAWCTVISQMEFEKGQFMMEDLVKNFAQGSMFTFFTSACTANNSYFYRGDLNHAMDLMYTRVQQITDIDTTIAHNGVAVCLRTALLRNMRSECEFLIDMLDRNIKRQAAIKPFLHIPNFFAKSWLAIYGDGNDDANSAVRHFIELVECSKGLSNYYYYPNEFISLSGIIIWMLIDRCPPPDGASGRVGSEKNIRDRSVLTRENARILLSSAIILRGITAKLSKALPIMRWGHEMIASAVFWLNGDRSRALKLLERARSDIKRMQKLKEMRLPDAMLAGVIALHSNVAWADRLRLNIRSEFERMQAEALVRWLGDV